MHLRPVMAMITRKPLQALYTRWLVAALLLLLALPALAQSQADMMRIEVQFDAENAAHGDIIYADVIVRAENVDTYISGVDVGIEVSNECLRMAGEREVMDYLTIGDEFASMVFIDEASETQNRYARLISLPDQYAQGDGVFFRVPLEVLCTAGETGVDVYTAEILSYRDPLSQTDPGTLRASTNQGNLLTTSASVSIGTPSEQQAEAPPVDPVFDPDADDPQDLQIVEQDADNGTAVILALIGGVALIVVFIALMVIVRLRKRKNS